MTKIRCVECGRLVEDSENAKLDHHDIYHEEIEE
jgi:hypothetical protein